MIVGVKKKYDSVAYSKETSGERRKGLAAQSDKVTSPELFFWHGLLTVDRKVVFSFTIRPYADPKNQGFVFAFVFRIKFSSNFDPKEND